jgi:hypothetical protein
LAIYKGLAASGPKDVFPVFGTATGLNVTADFTARSRCREAQSLYRPERASRLRTAGNFRPGIVRLSSRARNGFKAETAVIIPQRLFPNGVFIYGAASTSVSASSSHGDR